MPRLLVIDDHPSVRAGVCAMLKRELGQCVFREAGIATDAVSAVETEPWDAAILDMSMPGRSGPDLIAELKRLQPKLRVLVYTVHQESQLGIRCLRAGADGYITKDRPMAEFVNAVRTVLEGRKFISPGLAEALADAIVSPVPPHETLSDREMQVFRLLVAGNSITAISDELHLSVKTISTYRSRILEKLGASNTVEMLRYAVLHGLL